MDGVYNQVDMSILPHEMDVDIFVDLGDNSNQSRMQKLVQVGQNVLPTLNDRGQGMVIKLTDLRY